MRSTGIRRWTHRILEQGASFVADASASFRRNGLMTAAAVTTIMVALLVVGAAVLIGLNLGNVAEVVEAQVQVVAFLRDGLTSGEAEKVRAAVGSVPGVREIRFVGRGEALQRLQQQMGEHAAFADLASANPLPDSLEVQLLDPQSAAAVASLVAAQPGVTEVTYGGEVVDRLVALTRGLRAVAALLTLFLMSVALVVVVNTIRLTVIARRQEIEIMQLVGATRWFVRWPFLIEGLFQGAAAAVAAVVVLGTVYVVGMLRLQATMPFLPLAGPADAAFPLLASVLAAGFCVGAAGSLLAVRRFLTS
jgi:cell division transport system permease protein